MLSASCKEGNTIFQSYARAMTKEYIVVLEHITDIMEETKIMELNRSLTLAFATDTVDWK